MNINIVGLNRTDNGRLCENHFEGCGNYVEIGTVLRFAASEEIVNGLLTSVVKVYLVDSECTVAESVKEFDSWENVYGIVRMVNRGFKYGWAKDLDMSNCSSANNLRNSFLYSTTSAHSWPSM